MEEQNMISAMTDRLQKHMDVFIKENGYAFVKTSSRSAKDAPIYQKTFEDLYKCELKKVPHGTSCDQENIQITCLLKAAFQALKMTSGDQVVNIFVMSERIYQDMLLAVEVEQRFDENFVVRKFVEIDVDMEFRGFVYDGRLNALSQYNYLIYSERLHTEKESYKKLVCDFYNNKVFPVLKESNIPNSFVIDFAVCQTGNKYGMIITTANLLIKTVQRNKPKITQYNLTCKLLDAS